MSATSSRAEDSSCCFPRTPTGELQQPPHHRPIGIPAVPVSAPQDEEEAAVMIQETITKESKDNDDGSNQSSNASSKTDPEELAKVLKDYLAMKQHKNTGISMSTLSSRPATPMMINDAVNEPDESSRQRFVRVDDSKVLHHLDAEFETYHAEYRRNRLLLQQKVQEVDTNYMARSQMVQGKLKEALEKMKQTNEENLASAQDTWKEELESAIESSKELWDQERQERLDTISALRETLHDKFKLMEAINEAQEKQQLAQETADKERQGLKQEVKNILVTLHYQFEKLTNSLSTQEDERRVFEQAQRDLLADVENSVQDVTSYVDTVQHEVSQIQLESKAMWKQCEDEQNAARDILSKTILELVTQTKGELSTHLEEHDEQLQTVNEDLTQKMEGLENTLQKHLKESEERLTSIEEKAKEARTKFSKDVVARIQETEDTIFQSIDVHMSSMENHQREMRDRLDTQNKEHTDVRAVVTKVAEDFMKADRTFTNKYQDIENAVQQVSSTIGDHAVVATNLGAQISNAVKSTDDRFEQVCERLEKLENALAIAREARVSDREAAEVRSQEHLRYMGSLKEKLVDAHKYSDSLNDQLTKLQKSHTALENNYQALVMKCDGLEISYDRLGTDFESHVEATKQKDERVQDTMTRSHVSMSGILNNVAQLSKDLKCRSESHVLATKEFREELTKVTKRFEGVDQSHTKISNRMMEQENALSSIKVSELVDASMQPFWKQHEIIAAKIDTSVEAVRKLKEEVKTTKVSQEVFEERIKDVKATSESLFQHLANSVQTSQAECRDDVEHLKTTVETMESALQESSSKIAASREFMNNTVIEQKSSLHAVESKINSLKDEITSAMTRIGSRQTENKMFREELAKEQFSLKEKVSRSLEDLLRWKVDIEATVNDTKTNLTKDLISEQGPADEQGTAIVDEKLGRLSKKIEQHSADMETRISSLHEIVIQMKKENGTYDDSSISELRQIVNTLSEKIETTGVGATSTISGVDKNLLEAVDELRADMINRNSMVVELDDRMNSWVTDASETMRKIREGLSRQQLRGEVTDENNSKIEGLIIAKTKEVTDLETKVKEMSKKLTESRYECRGLRLKLLTKTHRDQDAGCASTC